MSNLVKYDNPVLVVTSKGTNKGTKGMGKKKVGDRSVSESPFEVLPVGVRLDSLGFFCHFIDILRISRYIYSRKVYSIGQIIHGTGQDEAFCFPLSLCLTFSPSIPPFIQELPPVESKGVAQTEDILNSILPPR